jgi:tyrosinase
MYKSYEEQRRGLHDHIDTAFRRDSINGFADTVEEAHGWVHGVIGGGWDGRSAQGHMWPLEYSAFEPLFMLHHTYVSPNILLIVPNNTREGKADYN